MSGDQSLRSTNRFPARLLSHVLEPGSQAPIVDEIFDVVRSQVVQGVIVEHAAVLALVFEGDVVRVLEENVSILCYLSPRVSVHVRNLEAALLHHGWYLRLLAVG